MDGRGGGDVPDHARDRDTGVVHLGCKPLGEALECGLLRAVERAAAHAPKQIVVRRATRADGRPARDVDDGAALAGQHVLQREL